MRLALAIAAIGVVLAVPATAQAQTTPPTMFANAAVATISESGGQDQADTTDTSTTDGYQSVESNGARRVCSFWHWTKSGYDLFGVKQWSETNHYNWCYYYGGKIYFRSGYDTQYTAPFWSVVKHNWGKTWQIPYIKAIANATATFHFDAGGITQTSSVGVCRWEGDKGGTGSC